MKNILLILTIAFFSCSDSNVKPNVKILSIEKPIIFEKNGKDYMISLISINDDRCILGPGFGGKPLSSLVATISVKDLDCLSDNCSDSIDLLNNECGELRPATTLEDIESWEREGSLPEVFGIKMAILEVFPKKSKPMEKFDLKDYQLHLVIK